jgi:hypothetical protein
LEIPYFGDYLFSFSFGFAEGGGSQYDMGQSQDNYDKGKTNFSIFYLFLK